MTRRFRSSAAALATLALLAVAGCSGDGSDDAAGGRPDGASETAGDAVQASDGWVKAATAADGMTAVFVTLENVTDQAVEITSVSTDMSDAAELHEMVEQDGAMVMQQASNGLSISPGGTLQLEPGGYHVMVMGLQQDVLAGETHQVTLVLGNGDHVDFEAVAKDFAGANESYHHTPAPSEDGDTATQAPDASTPPAGDDESAPSSHGG